VICFPIFVDNLFFTQYFYYHSHLIQVISIPTIPAGFIPGPILFGTLIDSACKLWQTTCKKTGACLLFDTIKFRNLTYGVSLGFQLLDLIFVVILFVLVRRSKIVFRSAAGTPGVIFKGKSWDSMATDKSSNAKNSSIEKAEKELIVRVTQV